MGFPAAATAVYQPRAHYHAVILVERFRCALNGTKEKRPIIFVNMARCLGKEECMFVGDHAKLITDLGHSADEDRFALLGFSIEYDF
jgi:hypothetical protein